jgi:hypothetical protein
LYNRVRPGGAIIVIQHRTGEDDLVGKLLEEQEHGGDKWEVVIPSHLGYGAKGTGAGNIGANETLVFTIELVEVEDPAKKTEAKQP